MTIRVIERVLRHVSWQYRRYLTKTRVPRTAGSSAPRGAGSLDRDSHPQDIAILNMPCTGEGLGCCTYRALTPNGDGEAPLQLPIHLQASSRTTTDSDQSIIIMTVLYCDIGDKQLQRLPKDSPPLQTACKRMPCIHLAADLHQARCPEQNHPSLCRNTWPLM